MAVPLVILRSDIFMEKKLCILAIFLLCICFGRVHAQAWSFEGGIPSRLSASCDKELAISEAYYKNQIFLYLIFGKLLFSKLQPPNIFHYNI